MSRLLLVLALAGCGGASDSDSGPATTGSLTGTPQSGTTSTGPTSGSPTGTPSGTGGTTGWQPTQYRVAYGWFGVRADQATTVGDVDLFGTPIEWPLQLAVRLADDTIDGGLTPDNHCDVVLTTTTPQPPAAWTADAGWFAVEFPADAAVSDSNCDFPLVADWSDPGARIAAHRWGLAVRALDPADLTAWGGYGTDDPLQGKLLGASWWVDAVPGPVGGGVANTPGIALGNAIDANGELLRTPDRDKLPMDADTIEAPGGVIDGFYELTPLSPWRDSSEL